MSRVRTRQQLIDRFIADRQERLNATSTYNKENVRRYLDQAWATIWQSLTDGEAGFGQQVTTLTAPSAGPTLDLPADFLSMHTMRRSQGVGADVPWRTTWKEVLRLRLDEIQNFSGFATFGAGSGYFLIEAPKSQTSQLAFQRLRFFPDLSTGEVVKLIYVTQPPSLANSDGTYTDTLGDGEDVTIQIDLYDETLIECCVSLARVRLANRSDSKEYTLAIERMGDVVAKALASRAKQEEGPPKPLASYRTTNSWGRI